MDRPTGSHRSDRPLSALTPALRRLLWLIGIPAGLLAINSLYLAAVTLIEQLSGRTLQNLLYLDMFLVHLGLGLLLLIPTLAFALLHARRAIHRPNRYLIASFFSQTKPARRTRPGRRRRQQQAAMNRLQMGSAG